MATTLNDSVLTRDGARLGFRRFGRGPGLVVLHGSMCSGWNHVQLAEQLADIFTVYLPDRRGRGLSGPQPAGYSVDSEVADLSALLERTGAGYLFGVSSGAIICLQAAATLPGITSVALFEPPLFLDPAIPAAFLDRYDREMAQGKVAAAMTTGMLGAQMGPPVLQRLPRWILEPLTSLAINANTGKGGYVSMKDLAPTLHYDFDLVTEVSGDLSRFRDLAARVLLLCGRNSPRYLQDALSALHMVLPTAERVTLPGLDHWAPLNHDQRGRPEVVATELRRFLSSQ